VAELVDRARLESE